MTPPAPAVNPTVVPLYAALIAITPVLAVMLVAPLAVITSLNVTEVPLSVKALTLVPVVAVVIVPASVTLTVCPEPANVFKRIAWVPLSKLIVPPPSPVSAATLFVVDVARAATAEVPPVKSIVKPVTVLSTATAPEDVCVIAVAELADAVKDIVVPAVAGASKAIDVPFKEKIPLVDNELVVVMLLLLLTVKLPNVAPSELRLRANPLLATVAAPVVFKVNAGVDVSRLPIVPPPEVNVTDVLPVTRPAALTEPSEFAPSVTMVPIAVLSTSMLPLLAVAVNDSAPLEFSAVVAEILLLFDTDKLVNVSPPEAKFKAKPALVMVTAPVVSTVKLGVDVLIGPTAPEPVVKLIDGVPVKVPLLCVIEPLPLAVIFTIVPEAL